MAKVELYDQGNIYGKINQLKKEWVCFRKLIPVCDALAVLAKEEGVSGISDYTTEMKKTFPDIDFLNIPLILEAEDSLYDLNPKQLKSLLDEVVDLRETGIFYKSAYEHKIELRHLISTSKDPKCFTLNKIALEKVKSNREWKKAVIERMKKIEEDIENKLWNNELV